MMNGLYDYNGSNSAGPPNLNNQNQFQSNYLNYLATSFANGTDFLNSSQNEKSWLNNSLNDKNWLNNSLCLPPEQRYQSLNEMVTKIVEDENQKSLMASGNSMTFSQLKTFPSTNQQQQQPQSQAQQSQHQIPLQPQSQNQIYQFNHYHPQQPSNIQFYRQDSFTNVKNDQVQNHNVESHQKPEFNKQTREQQNETSLNTNQNIYDYHHPHLNNNNQVSYFIGHNNFVKMNPVSIQSNPMIVQQNHIQTSNVDMKKQPLQQQNSAPISNQKRTDQPLNNFVPMQVNTGYLNLNRMPLAFPPSFSHQLATLSTDQQNYLLQQQRTLFLTLSATEQYIQNQAMHPANVIIPSQHQQLNRSLSNDLNAMNYNFQPVQQQMISALNHPTLKTQISSSSSSQSSNYSPGFSQYDNENKVNNYNHSFLTKNNFHPFYDRHNSQVSAIYENVVHSNNNENLNTVYNNTEKMKFFRSPSQPQMPQQQQAYRHHRRTGPANELHVRLEECLYQFKCLEIERKKIETELSYINLNRKFNNPIMNNNTNIPRLPPNPSRVDRLIYESFKEHSRLLNLISKIDNLKNTIFYQNILNTLQNWFNGIQNVQSKRKDELINNVNRQRLGQPNTRINSDEKDISLLANSINELSVLTSKTRTSLWCALQISNVNYNLQPGDTLFDTLDKTKEFIEKTFEIKTDLIDSKQI